MNFGFLLVLCTCFYLVAGQTGAGGAHIGCFKDNGNARDLPLLQQSSVTTVQLCLYRCQYLGYQYAGLQAGDWCACGNTFGQYGQVGITECAMPCAGNRYETCGGAWTNDIYSTSVYREATVSVFNRLGCFVDSSDARDLPVMHKTEANSRSYCLGYCLAAGFKYAALQASDWCLCGNTYGIHGRAADTECNSRCSGNSQETCGGKWRSEIFSTGVRKADEALLGCFRDMNSPRDLITGVQSGFSTTEDSCVQYCRSLNYKYAALQASEWCFCGNTYGRYGMVQSSECDSRCKGNPAQTCGGSWRNEIFVTGIRFQTDQIAISNFAQTSGVNW